MSVCRGTFFLNAPSFDFNGDSVTNPVLIARPDGTTLRHFTSIRMLTVAEGVSNSRIIGADAPLIETLTVHTTHPLMLDSVFINTVTLTHPSPLISDTLVSIDIIDIQNIPTTNQRLVISGKGEMAVGWVFGTQPVVESSVSVLSLNFASFPVALEV